jgi:hypothetical protein
MANTYVTISTPAGNVVKISEATSNKIVASGNTIKVISVGAQGPAGSGDLNAVHTQDAAASTWQVTHNLGKYPSVSVVDTANTLVNGKVLYEDWSTNQPSTSKLQIIFTATFAGKAFLN